MGKKMMTIKSKKDGREVKQKTKLQELDVRTKPIPEILKAEGDVDANMADTWFVIIPKLKQFRLLPDSLGSCRQCVLRYGLRCHEWSCNGRTLRTT